MAPPARTPTDAAIELAVALARCPRKVQWQDDEAATVLILDVDTTRQLDVFLLEHAGDASF